MAHIQILPESVVNKIAAGEVVERPASVVKELVENSLDAAATRIDIQLEEAGKRLIRVTDNGSGMAPDDLALAFVSHATSKLQTSDELFKITTLGFRGEALPSIGAVSQARIVSRAKGAPSGAEIEIRGGALGAVKERGAAEGTTVEVRNLFFNTPVRRKFFRSVPTEMSYISDMLTRLALAAPAVHFTLTHNGRQVFNLPPAQRLSDRIEGFFGKELAEDLIAVNWSDPSLTVSGFAAPPRHERSNTKMQFTFVNGRFVRDNTLLHAIGQTYHGLLLAKRCAIVFLFLETAPDNVDVNVHPTKIEVRFRDAAGVHDKVVLALRGALTDAHVVPTLAVTPPTPEAAQKAEERKEAIRQSLADFFASPAARQAPPPRLQFPSTPPIRHPAPAPPTPKTQHPLPPAPSPRHSNTPSLHPPSACLQVHGAYIVEETADGLNIIDQHALHERILHEEIGRKIRESRLPSQQLLVPEMVELSPKEFFAVLSLKADLARFGVEVEEFGQKTIVVRSFPPILKDCKPQDLLREVLDELADKEAGKSAERRLDKLIEIMACKAAVKSGKHLTPPEIRALLERRDTLPSAATCPHGRPTTLTFSKTDLEKQFKRR